MVPTQKDRVKMARFFLVVIALTLIVISYSTTNSAKTNDAVKQQNNNMKKDGTSKMAKEEKIDDKFIEEALIQCNETYRIDMSYYTALNESGSFPDETEREPKCNIRCMLITTGVSSEEREFDSARAAQVFAGMRGGRQMNDLEEMANSCAENRSERCKCERSYQFVKCLMEMEIMKYETNNK